ncbi:MAG: hypothetical protein WA130_16410 [Candidatus Methanoperedens sp.]
MTKEFVIKNCKIEDFNNMFGTRKEYEKLNAEMSLKERMFSHKPTNLLETNLKTSIVDKALIKIGSSGLRVTSYSIKKDKDRDIVYISYGGGGPRVLGVGRTNDFGGFFEAVQSGENVKIYIKTRYEYSKTWYVLAVIIGFMLFIIPGAILVIYFFMNHILDSKKINKNIVPVIIETFESRI